MKLQGNIINRMQESNPNMVTPQIGMRATGLFYSDRRVAEITKIIRKNKIEVKEVVTKYGRDGYATEYGEQTGEPITLIRNNKGVWKVFGGSTVYLLNTAEGYYDQNF